MSIDFGNENWLIKLQDDAWERWADWVKTTSDERSDDDTVTDIYTL